MDLVQGIWKSKSFSLLPETTRMASSLTKMMVETDQNYDYINFYNISKLNKIQHNSPTYDWMSMGD